MVPHNAGAEQMPGHACFEEHDARECYELRTYGYSPIPRSPLDHSEGAYLPFDADGECECSCHDSVDDGAPWEEDS